MKRQPDNQEVIDGYDKMRERVIIRYSESEGKQSWRDWILGIVGLLVVAGIGAVVYQLSDMKADLRASLTRQEMDEKRLDRVEAKLYRGTP